MLWLQIGIIKAFKWAPVSPTEQATALCRFRAINLLRSEERELNFKNRLLCPGSLRSPQTVRRKDSTVSGLSEQARGRQRVKEIRQHTNGSHWACTHSCQDQGCFLCAQPSQAVDLWCVTLWKPAMNKAKSERGREKIGGNGSFAVRVMEARDGCCQERLTRNTGIIVDMGVIFFPQCSRTPSGRRLERVKVLTGLCRNTRR